MDHTHKPSSGQNSHATPVSAARKVTKAKMAMKRQPSSRIGTKKLVNIPSVGLGQAEDLPGVDQVGIADLILVGAVDHGVMDTLAVVNACNVPEIVSPAHDQVPA